MDLPRLSVVILNTNRKDDTLACLQSLQASDYENLAVMVLDNASTDGSAAAIASAYPRVRLEHLTANLGYAGNNNVGIRLALEDGADWVLVLNEDTILAPNCLSKLIDAAQAHPQAGIVGPLVYHYDEPQVIQSAGGVITAQWEAIHSGINQVDQGQYGDERQVDFISGCAILVKRQVIEQVGMLDERYFYYWEETEWCLRAHAAGWQIWHIPSAKLWHKGVQRDYKPGPNVTYYNTRNRLMTLRKHHAPLRAWLTVWLSNLRTWLSWSLRPRWKHMQGHRDALWQGAWDYLRGRTGIRQT